MPFASAATHLDHYLRRLLSSHMSCGISFLAIRGDFSPFLLLHSTALTAGLVREIVAGRTNRSTNSERQRVQKARNQETHWHRVEMRKRQCVGIQEFTSVGPDNLPGKERGLTRVTATIAATLGYPGETGRLNPIRVAATSNC